MRTPRFFVAAPFPLLFLAIVTGGELQVGVKTKSERLGNGQAPLHVKDYLELNARRAGRLANAGYRNQRVRTTLFFAGQARDGSVSSDGIQAAPNLDKYTVHPANHRHLEWSVRQENRDFALTSMVDAGINVVTVSTWGEGFLKNVGWMLNAPMQTSSTAIDQVYEAAVAKPLLIMPLIESRGDWAFCDEFPRWVDGQVAPGLVSQIKDLIRRHLQNPEQPKWAEH